MHLILWSRITNRRLSNQNVTVAVLSTYQHRSFELADNGIIFTPQSDLVILNYIANYIIQNNAINQDFFSKHVNLRKGRRTSATVYVRPIRWKKQRRIRVLTLPNR